MCVRVCVFVRLMLQRSASSRFICSLELLILFTAAIESEKEKPQVREKRRSESQLNITLKERKGLPAGQHNSIEATRISINMH